MSGPAVRTDPIERARYGPSDPEPIVLRIRKWLIGRDRTVTLTPAGLAWDGLIGRGRRQAPWSDIGGVSVVQVRGQVALIKGRDGSTLGAISGWFEHAGPEAMLPHIVALYRPDLFVETEGTLLAPGGCIRREVADAEVASSTPDEQA
jgi:hypothetical protein